MLTLVAASAILTPAAEAAERAKPAKVTKTVKVSKSGKPAKSVKAAKASKSAKATQTASAKASRTVKSAKASRANRAVAQGPNASRAARSGRSSRQVSEAPARAMTASLSTGSAVSAVTATGASFGQMYGLHTTADPLSLKSSVALVMDQETNEVLLAKNSDAVLPIASLTKLMTALVVVEGRQPMDEMLTITQDDVDTEKFSSSRLAVGTTLSRGELLHLALMSSENRASHALGRHYPGGLFAFVAAMNAKARLVGMSETRYVDPTGLNRHNQSSARDLALLVKAAYQQPTIRELSVSQGAVVQVGARQMQFRNTNSLVKSPSWDIGLQKTGYIVEAGRCLVMQARMAGRKLIMVFLDSSGKYSRLADAERVRHWIESSPVRTMGPGAHVMPISQSLSERPVLVPGVRPNS